MKKFIIILTASLFLFSCGVNSRVDFQKNNNILKTKVNKQVDEKKVLNKTANIEWVNSWAIKLTPDDEKMINDLLNF